MALAVGLLLLGRGGLATWWADLSDRAVSAGTEPIASGMRDVVENHVDDPAEASGLLAELVVDDDLSDVPDYDRDAFGPAWADVDHTGCDQRNETLSAWLTDVTYRAGTRDCVVETGTFTDPYTGQTRPFVKGERGGDVDIDHLVPLGHAWESGAWAWTAERRASYANDLALLVPTDSSLNRSKGDKDVTQWLPPDEAYRCTYLERWVGVKTTWDLTVTSDELATLQSDIASCPAAAG